MKQLFTLTFIGIIALLHAALPSTPVTAAKNNTVTVLQSGGDKELSWVDEQIQGILPARVGVSEGIIGSLNDPMKLDKPKSAALSGNLLAPPKLGSAGMLSLPKIIEEPLRLQALINKSALINGKWYKLSDSVRAYTLSEIKNNSVLLIGKKNLKLVLFLSKPNDNIKITTK